MTLRICSGCRRFARGEICPFCSGELHDKPSRVTAGRMIAMAAIATTACASPAYGIAMVDSGDYYDSGVALYGGPPIDSGSDAAKDAGTDAPADAPMDAPPDAPKDSGNG
jgi:hypothetical protein